MTKSALMLVLLLLVTACGSDDEKKAEPQFYKEPPPTEATATPEPPPTATSAPLADLSLGPVVELGDGLTYRTVGAAADETLPVLAEGNVARLHLSITATHSDRELMNAPHGFKVGSGQGIGGLDKAVRGMRAGETREITIPSEMAKLMTGAPIPGSEPGSTVRVTATLLEIRP